MATCDMRKNCLNPVTHIGEKGFVYCAEHAPDRKGWERVRLMRVWERKLVEAGQPLPSYRPIHKPVATPPVPLSYEEILNRDVPTIREHARSWARQGVVAPIEIFYRHEAIAGQSVATTHDMTDEGWKPAGVTIPCNVPYDAYWIFLRDRLTRVPIFA